MLHIAYCIHGFTLHFPYSIYDARDVSKPKSASVGHEFHMQNPSDARDQN